MRLPLVTSEAGCAGHAPENTLDGVAAALRLGADAIEIDVHCTADGIPVLMHDERVDRTTNGTGAVCEMSLAALEALEVDAGSFAPASPAARVPTLAEVIELTKGKALLQIEIKPPGIEQQVIAVVRRADAIRDCESHSFLPDVVAAMRRDEPRMAAILLRIGRSITDWAEFFESALSLNAQGLSVYHAYTTAEIVRAAQRRGLSYTAWTVDEDADISRMLDAGVDSINSNFPERVRRAVDAAAGPHADGR